jgi:GAF domain-containing protein
VITDAKKDLHALYHKAAAAEGIGSVLAVPIAVKEEIIGMLRLLTAEIRSFSGADINFTMAVAGQSRVAIQCAMDYAKMQQALP